MTREDGNSGLGTLFSFNLLNNVYTQLQSFNSINGALPRYGALLKIGTGTPPVTSKYVKVNLHGGVNPYNNGEWNNWNTNSSLTSGNLQYSDGTPSYINASLSQQNNTSDNGTGYNSIMAPPEVVRYTSYSTTNRTLTISGLDNSKIYDLDIYASRKGITNNTTRFTISSTTIDVLTDNNLSTTVSFTSLAPVSGKIIVNIAQLNSYNYINGFILTETGNGASNPAPLVDAGDDETITLPLNSIQLYGSATDPNGPIMSYNWTKISGPSQYSFNNTSVPNPTVSNLVEGSYTFRLTVYDNQGASSFDDVTITVNPSAAPTRFVKVNLYGGSNPYNHPEWNNWNTSSSLSSGSLKYADGTLSSINAVLSQQNAISDNGIPYAATMAPEEVIRYASYSTASRTLTISGLDNSKTYNLELYASRKGATNNTTRFVIGSTTIDIVTDNNLSNKASFVSLTPVGGQIVVSISKLNSYNYLNGFILTENGSSATVTRKAPSIPDESLALPFSLNIYPNPVTDQAHLSMSDSYIGQMKVQVINTSGVIVKQFMVLKNEKSISRNFSLPDLKQGEYFIRVQMGNRSETKKFLKL